MKRIFLCALGLACMTVACNSVEEAVPVQYGEISVSLGDPEIEVITKAEPEVIDPSSPEAANYAVSILNSSGQEEYKAKYNEFITQKLALGEYKVTAEDCTEAEAESANDNKGKMRLYGETEINLTAENLSQTATVNCEVANARVAVVFDESVSGRFTDLKVELSGSRTVTVAETEAGVETETWFKPQTLTYKISGNFTQLDKEVVITDSKVLAAKNNVKIVVKLNLSNGQLLPEITIDTTIDDVQEIPGEFNPYN